MRGGEYEVLTWNRDFYDILKDCNQISSRDEYEKFMMEHHKKGIPLNSLCGEKIFRYYLVDTDVCKGMNINPYDYVDEGFLHSHKINGQGLFRCILWELLSSENLFIDEHNGEYKVSKKASLDDD